MSIKVTVTETSAQSPSGPSDSPEFADFGGENKWSNWYREQDTKDKEEWVRPALVAHKEIEATFAQIQLTSEEHTAFGNITTLDGFLNATMNLQNRHQQKNNANSRNAFQQNLVAFQTFAKTFAPVVDALKDAVPLGAGSLAWGLSAIVVTVLSNKHKQEKMFHNFISHIFTSLPRIEAYNQLYPTPRMAELFAQLYANIVTVLREAFIYYRRINWKGNISRVLSSASGTFNNDVRPRILKIGDISRDIQLEGLIGLSAEVRKVRLELIKIKTTTISIKQDTKLMSTGLGILSKAVPENFYDTEKRECEDAVSRIKVRFVPVDYKPDGILAAATRQLDCTRRTHLQNQARQNVLRDPRVVAWTKVAASLNLPKKIIWLTSSDYRDSTVSHCALRLLELIKPTSDEKATSSQPVIIQSMWQTEITTTTEPSGERTSTTILLEAIYQLLLYQPTLTRRNNTIAEFVRSTIADPRTAFPTNQLKSTLLSLLEALSGEKRDRDLPIFWIIDRIDTVSFSGHALRLGEFANVINELINQRRGRLRVLITSMCASYRMDGWSQASEDLEDNFAEIVYKGR